MTYAQTHLWHSMRQAFVACLHGEWNILSVADLITAREAAVEDFRDQNSIAVGVDSVNRAASHSVPAAFCNLGWCVSSDVRHEAALSEYDCIIFFHRGKNLESCEFPFTTV